MAVDSEDHYHNVQMTKGQIGFETIERKKLEIKLVCVGVLLKC